MQASSTLNKIETALPVSRDERLAFIQNDPVLKARYTGLPADSARDFALSQDGDGFESLIRYWSGNTQSFDELVARHIEDTGRLYEDA